MGERACRCYTASGPNHRALAFHMTNAYNKHDDRRKIYKC